MGFDLNFAGSSSASAANTAPFNFYGGGGRTNWIPWIVAGVVALGAVGVLAFWLKGSR